MTCGEVNFRFREKCFRCFADKNMMPMMMMGPNGMMIPYIPQPQMMEEWACGGCGMSNYATRDTCRGCRVSAGVFFCSLLNALLNS